MLSRIRACVPAGYSYHVHLAQVAPGIARNCPIISHNLAKPIFPVLASLSRPVAVRQHVSDYYPRGEGIEPNAGTDIAHLSPATGTAHTPGGSTKPLALRKAAVHMGVCLPRSRRTSTAAYQHAHDTFPPNQTRWRVCADPKRAET
jgi:hypothetical protein